MFFQLQKNHNHQTTHKTIGSISPGLVNAEDLKEAAAPFWH